MLPNTGEVDVNGVHHFPLRVYYSDTDAGGIVYHSNYLDFAEHGRTEMFDGLSEGHKHHMAKTGAGFVVSSINIQYKKPAYLDDILRVETAVTKCEMFTMNLSQNLFREKDLLCQMDVRVAYISLKEGKPLPIPNPWKDELKKLQQIYLQSSAE